MNVAALASAARGIEGDVVSHIADPATVRGRVVVGVVPLHLAAETASIDLPELPPEWRGRELSPAEMDQAGARLVRYRVVRLPPADGGCCVFPVDGAFGGC